MVYFVYGLILSMEILIRLISLQVYLLGGGGGGGHLESEQKQTGRGDNPKRTFPV